MDDDFDEGDVEEREEKVRESRKDEKKEKIIPAKKYNKPEVLEKIRGNPWIISTFVCGALVLILLITNFGGITGNVSKNTAGEKSLAFLESMGYSGLSVKSVEEVSGMYMVILDYNGQDAPFYITKDGKLVGSLSLIQTEKTKEIPQTERPKAELFIWAYCPHGVQAQSPFAEVASLLKDKADFEVVLYYDGHGDFETQQNKIQACIQENAKDKYWDYAKRFVEEIYPICSQSKDVACDKTESVKLMNSLGIDSTKILSCVSSQGESLIEKYSQSAGEMGVTGSPTLVVNGVITNPSSRTSESYKQAVCSGFKDIPSECSTELSSAQGTASGSC